MVMAILAVMATAAVDTGGVRLAEVEAPAPVMKMAEAVHRFDRARLSLPAFVLPLEPTVPQAVRGPVATDSTEQQRPVLIDYSDAYYTRLTIHKWASWAMLPLFGLAYYTGQDIYSKGMDAPRWERNIHGPVAATLAGLFAVNTVTGGLNLWEGRKDPNGRTWRTAHGLLMLLADAGFVAVGLTAPEYQTASGVFTPGTSLGESEGNPSLHRGLAMGSMAVAVVSWVMMLPPFRRD